MAIKTQGKGAPTQGAKTVAVKGNDAGQSAEPKIARNPPKRSKR